MRRLLYYYNFRNNNSKTTDVEREVAKLIPRSACLQLPLFWQKSHNPLLLLLLHLCKYPYYLVSLCTSFMKPQSSWTPTLMVSFPGMFWRKNTNVTISFSSQFIMSNWHQIFYSNFQHMLFFSYRCFHRPPNTISYFILHSEKSPRFFFFLLPCLITALHNWLWK